MARGPQRRGAQCSCIGCIGLRPALNVDMSKSESSQSNESRARQADSSKAYSELRPFKSRRHTETIPANSALQKCLKCAEAREKKPVEQNEPLKTNHVTQLTTQ